jgi:two-component system chemotaxis sensor kinase CheA
MSDSMDDLQRQLLKTFQVEAQEHLQKLNETLLQLERQPDGDVRQSLLQEIFRSAHSLKGAARAVSLGDIENLAHALETVLQQSRDAKLELTPTVCDALYDALDAIQQMLEGETVSVEPLSAQLIALTTGEPAPPSPPAPPKEEKTVMEVAEASLIPTEETIRVAVSKLDDLMAQAGELIMAEISASQHLADVRAIRERVTRWPKLWRDIKPLLPRLQGDTERRLADLLNRQNEYMQTLTREVTALEQSVSRDALNLSMSMTRLQDEVRRVRMVPFQTLVPGLQRAVRDVARSEDKYVAFAIEGREVELDKKVLETLKDPLLHLLRNAVIHGLETPEERTAAGKPDEGQINLTIRQQGSEVHIAVQDDGRGFDVEALRRTSADNGGPMFDSDANPNDIIATVAFRPGISTMKHVTELAGRGVGLDVVRQNIVNLRGRIKIENMPGQGVTISLAVPVSLTMSRGLLVQVGPERYALPLISVEKIVEARETFTIGGRAALRIEDRPVPLVSLASILERPVSEAKNGKKPLAVIVSLAEERLAVQVDDILTEQELAVKALTSPLVHVRNVEGAALLATGDPIVVLNVADLIKSARGAPVIRQTASTDGAGEPHPRPHILVVDDSITTRTLEKNILEAAGYQVTTAIDGRQALEKLEAGTFDLAVMDVQMPHLDGFALTQHLRDSAQYRLFPIILVTSLDSREDREQGMRVGADAYIVKRGFDQAELLEAIERLLVKEQTADA